MPRHTSPSDRSAPHQSVQARAQLRLRAAARTDATVCSSAKPSAAASFRSVNLTIPLENLLFAIAFSFSASAEFIFDATFLVFYTKFLVFSTKFIIFTHPCSRSAGIYHLALQFMYKIIIFSTKSNTLRVNFIMLRIKFIIGAMQA